MTVQQTFCGTGIRPLTRMTPAGSSSPKLVFELSPPLNLVASSVDDDKGCSNVG